MGNFTKFSINTIVTQFIVLLFSFVISIIIARVLGPEGKGQLALVLLIPTLSSTFANFGIGHAVNHFASKTSKTKIVINTFIISVLLGIISVLILLPATYFLKDLFFKTISTKLLVFISLCIPFFLLKNHFLFLIQGFNKFNHRNFLVVGKSVFTLVLVVLFTVIFKYQLNGAIIANILPLALMDVILLWFLLKEIGGIKAITPDFSNIKNLMRFGYKSHLGNILKDLSYRGDILIVSFFLSPVEVGYYVTAVTIAEVMWKIPNAIGIVLLSKISSLDSDDSRMLTPRVCRRLILPVLVISIFIFIFGGQIITLTFGKEFEPSVQVLMLLIPGAFSFSLWKILANDIIAQGYPSRYSATSAVALVIMIVMDIILVPKYGIKGAAVASTISYITATILIIAIYIQITRNTVKSVLIPLKDDVLFYINFIENIFKFKSNILNNYR